MLDFERIQLSNGLRVILHRAPSYQMVVTNLFIGAGSKHEQAGSSGLAHFCEHMMFTGTKRFPNYDEVIHSSGGNNNAFTTADFTNFYHTLPFYQIETGIQLEADRIMNLDFSEEKFEIQKKIILEEFKETVLNVPYGQKWHFIRPFLYENHGYSWPTIGASYEEVEKLTLEDCKSFFQQYYSPQNMVLGIAGNIDFDSTLEMLEKSFGQLNQRAHFKQEEIKSPIYSNNWGKELIIQEDVPLTNTMLLFPTVGRMEADFPAYDVISEWIAGRKQSPLTQHLVNRRELAHGIGSYLSGSEDPGFLSIEMAISKSIETSAAIDQQERYLAKLAKYGITQSQLDGILNRLDFEYELQETSLHNRIFSACYAEKLNFFDFFTQERKHYRNLTVYEVNACFSNLWDPSNLTRVTIEN